MAQNYITINGTRIKQPDENMGYNLETTYTESSGRVQSGKAYTSPMFTVESLSYKASNLSAAEMKQILKLVGKGKPFQLHYFSPYYGEWRTDNFYVGQGSLSIHRLNENAENYDSLSFNMIGVNPI